MRLSNWPWTRLGRPYMEADAGGDLDGSDHSGGEEKGEDTTPGEGNTEGEETTEGGSDKGGERKSLLEGAGKTGGEDDDGKKDTEDESEEASSDLVEIEKLKLPEDKKFERDEALGKSFVDIINDEKLSRLEMAQKLTDLYVQQQSGMLEAMQAAEKAAAEKWKEDDRIQQAAWEKASREDPEFGGEKFEANMTIVAAGRDKVASPELTKIVNILGLGNHPEILRMYYRAGKLSQEDRGAGAGAEGAGKKPIEERIFGKVTQNL